jgi:hypothetical protein
MTVTELLLALRLLTLTTADGKTIEVNPEQIVAFRAPRLSDAFVEGAQCLVFTADGKFISAKDTCDRIREILIQAHAIQEAQ